MPDTLIESLQALARLELAAGALYQACALRWPEESQFWMSVARQETAHAGMIERMSSLVALNQDDYALAKPIKVAAVNTIISGIEQKAEMIRTGHLHKVHALHTAVDLENSFLEKKFYELVQTKDPAFHHLCREIMEQTREHKQCFERRIAALNA